MNEIDKQAIKSLDQAILANQKMVSEVLNKDLNWCTSNLERMSLMKTVARLNMDIRRMLRLKRAIFKESNSEEKN